MRFRTIARGQRVALLATVLLTFLLSACTHPSAKGKGGAAGPIPRQVTDQAKECKEQPDESKDADVADIRCIPQEFKSLPAIADLPCVPPACSQQLHDEFIRRFFTPWTSPTPTFNAAETKTDIKERAQHGWYGVNSRKMPRKMLDQLLENSALDSFPSQNLPAIAVAPGHLRGLPTKLPLYDPSEGAPFDMLAFPQVKLNEPLRVQHVSRDGAWLFVETPYSNGWLERRDVALVDQQFIKSWMDAPHVVIVTDNTAVADGKGIGFFQAKIGTLLPLECTDDRYWEVKVASAGDGGKVETRLSRVPAQAAASFPLQFSKENVALIGDQLVGEPYGWGEIFGLRDCSALLRDFFLPFGIWLPRTSGDQMDSTGEQVKLKSLPPMEKEKLIKTKGVPFLTLLHKPGHIMLYVGVDGKGEPMAFHGSWSIRVKDEDGERTKIIGMSAITTLHPGSELGLVPGTSLLDKLTEMGTVTGRCTPS